MGVVILKKWIFPLTVLAIFLGLLAFTLYDRPVEEDGAAGETQPAIFSLAEDEIAGISLTHDQEQIELVREGDDWWVMPGHLKGNNLRIDTLARTLAGLEAGRVVATSGADLTAYGLDRPAYRVKVQLKDGKSATLLVGAATPVKTDQGEGEYYVKKEDTSAVYTLSQSTAQMFQAGKNDFRNLYFFKFSLADVADFVVEWGDLDVAAKLAGTEWQLSRPQSRPVDMDKVTSFLDQATFLEPQEYVQDHPEAADLERFGFTTPQARIVIHQQAEPKELVAEIGARAGEDYYVRRTDEPYIYLVAGKEIEEMRQAAQEMVK